MNNNEISKGVLLERIFKHSDKLDLFNKQLNLFKKNNLIAYDLYELKKINITDYNIWYKLHKRSERITTIITYIILER